MSTGNAGVLSWLSRTERVRAAESSPRIRRLRRKTHVAQSFEYWQCEDFAMAESHGTSEFIGGGELGPHPETAAQTHGWRQPLGDYTENGPARRRVLPRAGSFKKSLARALSRRLGVLRRKRRGSANRLETLSPCSARPARAPEMLKLRRSKKDLF